MLYKAFHHNKSGGEFSSYHRFSSTVLTVFVGLLFTFFLFSNSKAQSKEKGQWIGTWGASPQLVEPRNMPPKPGLSNNTLRQVVHVSLGGNRLRLELSNNFGTTPITLKSVHVAVTAKDSSAIIPSTDKTLTFKGKHEVTIPARKAVMSDPFNFHLKPLSNVTITIHYGHVGENVTGHPGSRTTSFLVKGDKVTATNITSGSRMNHWYTIERLDVVAPKSAKCVVALGNSITDGHASGTNKNGRWTDDLARRLQANPKTKEVSVLNAGIGGNCILHGCLGPTALNRFYNDVIDQPKVKWLIILEGINDIGGARGVKNSKIVAKRIIDAYKWMIKTAHAHGIKVYGGTLTPFAGSFYDKPGHMTAWRMVNKWIRNSGRFDAVIPFYKSIRDPAHPLHILPKYDSGGHLHPNPLGYRKMAQAINLKLFE